MKQQIVIIGSGVGKTLLQNAVDHPVIVAHEEDKERFFKPKPFVIRNPYAPNPLVDKFICKGKHQYREVRTENKIEWICQCGKKL